MKRKLTPLAWILLIVAVVGLTVSVCVTAGCKSPASKAKQDADLSVGATVRSVRDAMYLWKEYVSSHPMCSGIVTAGCIKQEDRERVAKALSAYAAIRGRGARSASDTKRDSAEAIRASRDFVVAVADVLDQLPEEAKAKLAKDALSR